MQLASDMASHFLMRKYGVIPDWTWENAYLDKLLKTFESIPQQHYGFYEHDFTLDEISVWKLADYHIQDDIVVEYDNGIRVVTVCYLRHQQKSRHHRAKLGIIPTWHNMILARNTCCLNIPKQSLNTSLAGKT